eukprot:TRINITY_DN12479_c0_g1_i1.p1 TRINITY_DN12479_c0_g1~~TRINITY_DN12479_c0_g1_i1.p1  ORF type:complete len:480 (+),score=86.60 TRINITY_DN12479_c0_g1_i1:36-1442(+)
MAGVESKAVPGRGVALFATKDFDVGSVILEETPLVTFEIGSSARIVGLDEICSKHQVPKEMFYSVIAVLEAGEKVQAKVDELFCPSDDDINAFEACREQYRIVRSCLDAAFESEVLPKKVDVQRFWKLLLICQCNAVEVSQGMALFETFSRGNHSCRPNAWHCMQKGRKVIRAVRSLKAGDEITYSYLGLQDLLKGSSIRNKELELTKCFSCSCDYCCLDTSRAFHCPKCKSLAVYFKEDGNAGIACQSETCGEKVFGENAKALLDKEAEWSERVLDLPQQLQQKHKGDPQKAFQEVLDLTVLASGELHPQNWIVNFLHTIQRDFHQHILQSPPVETAKVLQKLLTYAKQVYPGISYCSAIAHHALGEEYLKAIQRRDDFRPMLEAEKHLAEALRIVEICNGPQHDFSLDLKKTCKRLAESLSSKCANEDCIKLGSNKCAGCKSVAYCGQDCQAAHWKRGHKKVCKKK